MFLSKTICSAIIFLTKVQFPPSFSIATILKFDRVIYTHLIITRRRVPESCDCFRQLLLLLPLTLQLDNTVATPAKHPILCRYSSIETPIPVGLLSSWSFKLVFLLVSLSRSSFQWEFLQNKAQPLVLTIVLAWCFPLLNTVIHSCSYAYNKGRVDTMQRCTAQEAVNTVFLRT